jgi:hypothetical protein
MEIPRGAALELSPANVRLVGVGTTTILPSMTYPKRVFPQCRTATRIPRCDGSAPRGVALGRLRRPNWAPTVRDLCGQARSSLGLAIFHRGARLVRLRALLRGNGECAAEAGSRPRHPRTYTGVLRLGKETIFSSYGLANTPMSRWVSHSVWFPDPLAVLRFRNANDRDNSHSILEWADLHFFTRSPAFTKNCTERN